MSELSLQDLKILMRGCAGVDDEVDLDGDIGDMEFADLGYDSLAVMEIQARIQQEYGVAIPESMLDDLTTPTATIKYVNEQVNLPT